MQFEGNIEVTQSRRAKALPFSKNIKQCCIVQLLLSYLVKSTMYNYIRVFVRIDLFERIFIKTNVVNDEQFKL